MIASYSGLREECEVKISTSHPIPTHDMFTCGGRASIKTHNSESRGQEEAGRTRDEQVSYLHVAPL